MDTQVFIPFILLCYLLSKSTIAVDTIAPNGTLHDPGQTLTSKDGRFELGFFSPWNSNNRYIGIWFKKVPEQTVFWVANKNNPLSDSSGILTLTTVGNIIISNNQSTIWSSNSAARNPVLQLLNTGNLVVKDSSGSYMWQSFDHPCDTLIPGMKLGFNFKTGQEWYLTSWQNLQDPSDGEYTYRFDPNGLPQTVLRRGTKVEYRSGPWDGVRFGGSPALAANPAFKPIFVFNETSLYYSFENNEGSVISRFVVNQTGLIKHLSWSQTNSDWVGIAQTQTDNCDDNYAYCGPNGICIPNGWPICKCPTGFIPKLPLDWQKLQWTGGCVKRTETNCGEEEGFRKFSGLKLPDKYNILVNSTNSVDCEDACLRNCTCLAYAKTDVSGCVMWYGNLIDIKQYNEGGQNLYIRMAASELDSGTNRKRTMVIISVVVIVSVVLLGFVSRYAILRRKRRKEAQDYNEEIGEEDLELPLFDLATITTATNDFSFRNKLGEGGFGSVYKGILSTGQEIAVKRLSKDSGQGLKELKNEIILISKLQHRNLVKLLGFCIYGKERMLIYEYMPNKSLDFFIFNQKWDASLDWKKRFDIIVGIARGLVYLHRDSRLRIIHRDLKASNILLDHDMNPKISDFGLARMFRADQTEAKTRRVIGTYGYMSPEYAIDGHFSVKSDVFSFGVLVLEIVSGQKNRGYYYTDHDLNLLGHAWKLWNEDRPLELVNASIKNPVPETEVLRCIQVGLLCVQQRPEDRPTISHVLLMLDSENIMLPQPKQPGFYTERYIVDTDSSTGKYHPTSNEVTVTVLHAR